MLFSQSKECCPDLNKDHDTFTRLPDRPLVKNHSFETNDTDTQSLYRIHLLSQCLLQNEHNPHIWTIAHSHDSYTSHSWRTIRFRGTTQKQCRCTSTTQLVLELIKSKNANQATHPHKRRRHREPNRNSTTNRRIKHEWPCQRQQRQYVRSLKHPQVHHE